MSIYHQETVANFNRAMESIWYEQLLKPNEIILVQDGPLYDELYEVIVKWKNEIGTNMKVINIEKNSGLANALNIGIQHASHELIARMDTDDISLPERFKEQIAFMKEHPKVDVLGSWISEFENNESIIQSYRKVPSIYDDILVFAKRKCPMNHPSVMYKKNVVLNVGGYDPAAQEDYYLWVKLLINGVRFANIEKALVHMRTGYGQLLRRRGLKYAISEYQLQRTFYSMKFITIFEFLHNVSIRFVSRLMPKFILKYIYQRLRINNR
jgi:glycosyltransferase involved in cell wall biosynthesis